MLTLTHTCTYTHRYTCVPYTPAPSSVSHSFSHIVTNCPQGPWYPGEREDTSIITAYVDWVPPSITVSHQCCSGFPHRSKRKLVSVALHILPQSCPSPCHPVPLNSVMLCPLLRKVASSSPLCPFRMPELPSWPSITPLEAPCFLSQCEPTCLTFHLELLLLGHLPFPNAKSTRLNNGSPRGHSSFSISVHRYLPWQ